jgi:outer membrane protein assembly factor BamA
MLLSTPLVKKIVTYFLVSGCLVYFGARNMSAQSIPSGDSEVDGKGEKNFRFVPIPYIGYNRAFGFSIGLIPTAMYRLNPEDTVSPASISGLLAIYNTNGSYFVVPFSRLFFKEDRWRINAAAGLGNINYQFYSSPIEQYTNYNTGAKFGSIEVQRKIFDNLYFGINYLYTRYNTRFDLPVTIENEVTLHGLGAVLSYDNRSNVYYPRGGFFTNLNYKTFPEFLGNDFVSNTVELDHNHYFSVRSDKDVIAARLFLGFGIGEVSFNQQFVVGQTDIRGYTQGRYRGNNKIAIQGEYRWNFHRRMSGVGFAGLATIPEAINEEDSGKLLPGIGIGYRFTVIPEEHFNVGLDVAVGLDDWGIYFRMNEAF